MTVKCKFCKDTKIEPGIPGPCVWCEEVEPVTLGTVTRYAESCGEGGGVIEHASGQFVEFKDYDAALGREAALREELALIIASFDELAACVDFSEARLDQTGDSPIDCANQIQQRLTVAEQRNTVLESALKFYADGDHLLLADADAWDTCSGEPINFLHDEAGTASVEDGSIAKAALKPAAEGEGA